MREIILAQGEALRVGRHLIEVRHIGNGIVALAVDDSRTTVEIVEAEDLPGDPLAACIAASGWDQPVILPFRRAA